MLFVRRVNDKSTFKTKKGKPRFLTIRQNSAILNLQSYLAKENVLWMQNDSVRLSPSFGESII